MRGQIMELHIQLQMILPSIILPHMILPTHLKTAGWKTCRPLTGLEAYPPC
jgi:hypothetical protein